jgi:hypothetical protein
MITNRFSNCVEAYGSRKPLGVSLRFQCASDTLHALFNDYVRRGWWCDQRGWVFDDPDMSDTHELRAVKEEFFQAADELSELRRRHLLRKCGWLLLTDPKYGVVRQSDGCSLYF